MNNDRICQKSKNDKTHEKINECIRLATLGVCKWFMFWTHVRKISQLKRSLRN